MSYARQLTGQNTIGYSIEIPTSDNPGFQSQLFDELAAVVKSVQEDYEEVFVSALHGPLFVEGEYILDVYFAVMSE